MEGARQLVLHEVELLLLVLGVPPEAAAHTSAWRNHVP
jgi:hypothetical protein